MCIIPYGTQMGEISFCAYNTGHGWRQIVERMHRTASTREWYRSVGKHKVYANRKAIDLAAGPDPVLGLAGAGAAAGASCGCGEAAGSCDGQAPAAPHWARRQKQETVRA
jgi:hypothetical protein